VVEDGELWAQKQCEFKPISTALQSRAYKTSNPRATRGCSLVIRSCLDPEEISFNGHMLVVETLAHSINRRHGIPGRRVRFVSPREIHAQSDRERYTGGNL
jgi:hypothetical protein